jgi:S-adenosylmethionine uptake transporter
MVSTSSFDGHAPIYGTLLSRWQLIDANVRGIVCVMLGMTVFSGQDVAIKFLSDAYPLHEIVFARSIVGLVLTITLIMATAGVAGMKTGRPLWHCFRAGLLVLMNMTYFTALASLPIAETMAMFFIAPLLITVMSAVLLRERVGVRRGVAVAVGLAGVLIMLRPGGSVTQAVALLPLFAAFCYAIMQITTRYIGTTETALTMALFAQAAFLVTSGTFGVVVGDGAYAGAASPSVEFLLRAWVWPDAFGLAIFAACGFSVAIGAVLLSEAYRIGQAATIAPFEYVALPVGILWGWLVFDDSPDALSFMGIALIGGAGLYVFLSARRVAGPPVAKHSHVE